MKQTERLTIKPLTLRSNVEKTAAFKAAVFLLCRYN
jgi:hypothetical protein